MMTLKDSVYIGLGICFGFCLCLATLGALSIVARLV